MDGPENPILVKRVVWGLVRVVWGLVRVVVLFAPSESSASISFSPNTPVLGPPWSTLSRSTKDPGWLWLASYAARWASSSSSNPMSELILSVILWRLLVTGAALPEAGCLGAEVRRGALPHSDSSRALIR